MNRMKEAFSSPVFRLRVLMSLLGVVICAISVGMFKTAALGVDPFQSLMSGLDAMIPISFGTLYVIANAVLLIFSLIADRHYIGIATFINLFLLGYITQFTQYLLEPLFAGAGLVVRLILLLVAIVILCFASALYMTADLGVSTYDAVALVITGTWKKGKFKYVRIITDLCCVCIGAGLFLAAGHTVSEIPTVVGIGTIITAFFMGPLIEVFNEKCARPMLRRSEEKTKG